MPNNPVMRALVAASCLAILAALSCTGIGDRGPPGYSEGQSCDPTLLNRDCEEGLVCSYSYDECPQYGCPKCRRPCREDADCSVSQGGCDTQKCIQQRELEERGVCQVCSGIPPILPP